MKGYPVGWLALELQEYSFEIEIGTGKAIPHAAGLSRPPFIKVDDTGEVAADESVL